MEASYYIQSYCHIKEEKIALNGASIFEVMTDDFATFIRSAYKTFETEYPKFFKMDDLSKLGFMAAEVLFRHENITPEKKENIALILANRASSLDTDRKHQASIEDPRNYFPSPAVFVYTLPNILMGEISIRYKLYSENSFFIFDAFEPSYMHTYCNSLLNDGKADKVLCGWVEFDGSEYEAFMYLISKTGGIPHQIEGIKKLYKTPWKI